MFPPDSLRDNFGNDDSKSALVYDRVLPTTMASSTGEKGRNCVDSKSIRTTGRRAMMMIFRNNTMLLFLLLPLLNLIQQNTTWRTQQSLVVVLKCCVFS